MNWYEKCLSELDHYNLFDTTAQRERFRDLISCYFEAPFFSKGLAKCMYLACWDDEHFGEILLVLNELTIDGDKSTHLMADQGPVIAAEAKGFDHEAMLLSTSFLTGDRYRMPDLSTLDAEHAHILKQTVMAAERIDELPDL